MDYVEESGRNGDGRHIRAGSDLEASAIGMAKSWDAVSSGSCC